MAARHTVTRKGPALDRNWALTTPLPRKGRAQDFHIFSSEVLKFKPLMSIVTLSYAQGDGTHSSKVSTGMIAHTATSCRALPCGTCLRESLSDLKEGFCVTPTKDVTEMK